MTNAELIAYLKKLPLDLDVVVHDETENVLYDLHGEPKVVPHHGHPVIAL